MLTRAIQNMTVQWRDNIVTDLCQTGHIIGSEQKRSKFVEELSARQTQI